MDNLLKQKTDLFIENRNRMAQAFKWSSNLMNLSSAYLFTTAEREVDADAMKAAEAIVKQETGAFSAFRGNVRLPLLAKMVLSGQPDNYLAKVTRMYDLLKQRKWQFTGDYSVLAAMVLADNLGDRDPEALVDRVQTSFNDMKAKHPWLTSNEDLITAALLATTEADPTALTDEAERNHTILKQAFRNSNAVQSLSHVLALGEAPAEAKCARVVNIFEGLKSKGHKYSTAYQLPALGTLALLDVPEDQLVDEIIAVDDYLADHKGFGDLALGSPMRRMYAAQIVLNHQVASSARSEALVLGSMVAFTTAMQMASMTAMLTAVIVTTTMLNN